MFTLALNVFYVLVAYIALVILVAFVVVMVILGRRVIEDVAVRIQANDSILKEMKTAFQDVRISLPSKDADSGRILYGIPPGMYRVDTPQLPGCGPDGKEMPLHPSERCIPSTPDLIRAGESVEDALRRLAAENGIPVIGKEEMLKRLRRRDLDVVHPTFNADLGELLVDLSDEGHDIIQEGSDGD